MQHGRRLDVYVADGYFFIEPTIKYVFIGTTFLQGLIWFMCPRSLESKNDDVNVVTVDIWLINAETP